MGMQLDKPRTLKRPHETDEELETSLLQQCGLRRAYGGLTTSDTPKPDLEMASKLVRASLAPAQPEQLLGALAKLSTLVARRAGSDESAEILLAAYTENLLEYPADVAISALAAWPKRSQWWPTWFELQEVLEPLVKWRWKLLEEIERMQRWEATPRIEAPREPRVPTYEDMTDEEKQEVGAGLRAMADELSASLTTAQHATGVISLRDRLAERARGKSRRRKGGPDAA